MRSVEGPSPWFSRVSLGIVLRFLFGAVQESDLQALICFCRLSFAVGRLSQQLSTTQTPEKGFQRWPSEEN